MRRGVPVLALGNATSLFLALTFTVCVLFDLAFPERAMFDAWRRLLPGFEWATWRGFLVGLAESYLYGWYVALVWAPLYNFFVAREQRSDGAARTADRPHGHQP